MLRFYRNNYLVPRDTCSAPCYPPQAIFMVNFISSDIVSSVSPRLDCSHSVSPHLYIKAGQAEFQQIEMKTFFVCQPSTRRPIINMFTKVSMGAKFREFMRIEKRSSVCVIYQWDQHKQIYFCIRKYPEWGGWSFMYECCNMIVIMSRYRLA